MPLEFAMPRLGLTMEEGTIVRWLCAEGEQVERGQILVEVETDKVVIEVEAPGSGILGPLLVAEGERVPVGTLLTTLAAPGEAVATRASVAAVPAPVSHSPARLAMAPSTDQAKKTDHSFSSPRARKRAREQHLDWRLVKGSGPNGRVIERDVVAASVAPFSEAANEITWITPTAVQRVTAERMTASAQTAPQFCLAADVLFDALLDLRERLNATEDGASSHVTVTDLLIRVIAGALCDHPRANASWHQGRIALHARAHIGFATATDAGLVVPVLRDAARKSLWQIAEERRALVERARAGRLTTEDLTGGTFTLSNLGMTRVDAFQAILNPPQAAILAVGRVAQRPVVVDGALEARRTARLTLTCDHRVLDGAVAAAFLSQVAETIENPAPLA